MSIVDKKFIREYITNNQVQKEDLNGNVYVDYEPVPYRWTHGATDLHIGDGILIYSIIQMMRYKNIICLGSGGGFIPRIMTQARIDLHNQEIFTGNPDYNWGDIGTTYLVDAANGVGGQVDYLEEDSFFRSTFYPRFINSTTEEAYYNFFVKQDIKADFLYIDAGHSYEDVKNDFELYTNILSDNALVCLHDTDQEYHNQLLQSEDEKKDYISFDGPAKFIKEINEDWNRINFFNSQQIKNKPSSTGITLVQKR